MEPSTALIVTSQDDASQDNTAEVVNGLMKEDSRLKLLQNRENKGVGFSRNVGVRSSKGVIIVNHDADDVSLSDRIIKQIIPIYEKSVDFTLIQRIRSHCKMDELDLSDETSMLELVHQRSRRDSHGMYFKGEAPWISTGNAAFRRECFEIFGLYLTIRYAEDIEYLERIFYKKAKCHFDNDKKDPHIFLYNNKDFPGIYNQVDEVLLICSENNPSNLTTSYESNIKKVHKIKDEYRKQFIEVLDFPFPKLKQGEILNKTIPRMQFIRSSFKNGSASYSEGVGLSLTERDTLRTMSKEKLIQLCEIYSSQIEEIRGSFSWKLTAPMRALGRPLKRN